MKLNLKSLLKFKKSSGGAAVATPAKQLPPQVEKTLIWVKANFLLVLLATVSVAALGGGWWFQDEFRTTLAEEASTYAGKGAELARLQTGEFTITIPGSEPMTQRGVVNEALVTAVKQLMGQGGGSDSAVIRADAVARNRGAHESVVNLRIPAKSPERESVHQDFFKELGKQYDALLLEVDAGSPPSDEDVTIKLQRRQGRFAQNDLKKAADATLTTEERSQLQPVLVSHRLGLYSEVAQSKGIYCEAQDIGMPNEQPAKADFKRMWALQWQLWVAQDIVRACKSVNATNKIPDAPIKRITRVQFLGPVLGGVVTTSDDSSSSAAESDPAASGSEGVAPGLAINPSAPVTMDQFGVSRKGWTTNQLYDVFSARVTLIVETTKIPQISNAFSKQNFIVMTDVKIRPVDPFAAANEGFIYGNQALSELTLTMESAWLREWTGPLMPDDIRKQLNTSGMLAGLGQDAATEPAKEN